MFKHIPELSLWEISHYWHGYSPDETDPKKLPAEVQGTLRVLAVAGTKGPVLRLSETSLFARIIRWMSPELRELYFQSFALVLQWFAGRAYVSRCFSKKIFDGIKIHREEFARWCKENNKPLPPFWFPENEAPPEFNHIEHMRKFAGDKLVYPLLSPCIQIAEPEKPSKPTPDLTLVPIDAPEPPGEPEAESTASVGDSTQQILAAQRAHAARNELIDRFLHSIKDAIHQPDFNGTKSACAFYDGLTEEEQLQLAQSPEKARKMPLEDRQKNAVQLLTRAITAFKKGERLV